MQRKVEYYFFILFLDLHLAPGLELLRRGLTGYSHLIEPYTCRTKRKAAR